MPETEFRLSVNGEERSVTCEPGTPLLEVLRHDLGLAGPKFGCGMGLCGACFVLGLERHLGDGVIGRARPARWRRPGRSYTFTGHGRYVRTRLV